MARTQLAEVFLRTGIETIPACDLIQAAAWLDGVHHGMQQASDKPVMVRRPYETEATPVDDATDLTVAT